MRQNTCFVVANALTRQTHVFSRRKCMIIPPLALQICVKTHDKCMIIPPPGLPNMHQNTWQMHDNTPFALQICDKTQHASKTTTPVAVERGRAPQGPHNASTNARPMRPKRRPLSQFRALARPKSTKIRRRSFSPTKTVQIN